MKYQTPKHERASFNGASDPRDFSTEQRCVIRAVADVTGATWADLTGHPQRHSDARAVLIAMLIWKCDMSLPQVAKFIGRTKQAVKEAHYSVMAWPGPALNDTCKAVSDRYWEILRPPKWQPPATGTSIL